MSTILALDIGTEFVKAVLAKPGKKGRLEILGVGKAKQSDDITMVAIKYDGIKG